MESKFKIYEEVRIKRLKLKGTILSIFASAYGIEYEVRYLSNSKQKNIFLLEDEIEKLKVKIERRQIKVIQ